MDITLEKVEYVLKSFAKSKSPCLDGWSVQFFWGFFDILGNDLVEMVEETRRLRKVSGSINSTFISLIWKTCNPLSFKDFRPISLCNLIYKFITKILANKIKHVLARYLSKEQFGFLKDHQIMEAIRLEREGIHSIKTKNLKALILKMDLVKSYDKVNRNFMRLIMLQIRLPPEVTNWIMGCVSIVCYYVLVNGKSTSFFKGGRGI